MPGFTGTSFDRSVTSGASLGDNSVGLSKLQQLAAGSLIVGAGTSSAMTSLAMGTALQQLRVNAGATALEWAAAGEATAFSNVTAGTGTAALVVGAGGSLSTTSTGTITATSVASALQAAAVFSPYGTSAGNTGEARWLELAAGGVNYVGFKAPDALAGNTIYTLPTAFPGSTMYLTSTTAGVLAWAAVASGASFDAITSGTNTTATMAMGTGSSITLAGTATVGAVLVAQLSSSATTIHIGAGSGAALTTAIDNTLVGNGAGSINITGADNTYVGYRAGVKHTGGTNTFIGSLTGAQTTSNASTDNVAVGYAALGNASYSGSANTSVGSSSTPGLTSGANNVFLGFASGGAQIAGQSQFVNGSNSTYLGSYTGTTATNATGSIAIGCSATTTASSQLVIGSGNCALTAGYLGQGVKSGSPAAFMLTITGGRDTVDTNLAGVAFTIAGSLGTGNAAPGSLLFSTSTAVASGTGAQSLTTRLTISSTAITAALPFIVQSLTAAQIGALTPVLGMIVYQTDGTTGFYGYNGAWVHFTQL